MRFDENTRNLLILKLRFSPASVLQLEKNGHLVKKTQDLLALLRKADANRETKQFASEQLKKIRQWVDGSMPDPKTTLKLERQAYYSFL